MSHPSSIRQLTAAAVVTGIIFLLQLVGALLSRSVSLLSNAGHLFTDVGSIGLALYAARIEKNAPTEQLSYGFGRSGIVAAFVNGLLLAAIAVALVTTSIFRLAHPRSVNVNTMIVVTIVTLMLNVAVTLLLHTKDSHDVNRLGVYWHAVGDSLSSVGILIAAFLIRWTGWAGWDPTAALAVGLTILWASYKVGRPSLLALMEATPETHRIDEIQTTMLSHPDVTDVHHIHVWSLAPEYHALSAHVRLSTATIREGQRVIDELTTELERRHGIEHVTIQLEADDHRSDETHHSQPPPQ